VSICSVNPLSTGDAQNLVEKKLIEIGFNLTKNNISIANVGYLATANKLALLEAYNPDYGDENRKKLGFNIQSFMLCMFDEIQCIIASEIQWYYDVLLGNCFRFNSGFNISGHSIPLKQTINPGINNGLNLYLMLEYPANKYSHAPSEGLRVFIHNNSANPSQSTWVDIKLTEMTNIAIKRTFIQKQPYPYSECIDLDNYDSEYYTFIKSTNKSYIQEDCYSLCLQRNVIQNCNCYSLYFPKLYDSQPCLNQTQLECYIKEYFSFKTKTVDESCAKLCPLECESVIYDLLRSSTSYPTKFWYDFYKDKVPNLDYDTVKERVLAVNIYYSQNSYTKISESPKTSKVDLLSNMGGTLGLYIGISFLSFIEIVEMILEIIFISLNK